MDRNADELRVFAEAFDRDQNGQDFSLAAMVAHECGHQRLFRDPQLAAIGRKLTGQIFEEVLASLIGSCLVSDARDRQHLVWKATADLSMMRLSSASVGRTIEQLRVLLKELVK